MREATAGGNTVSRKDVKEHLQDLIRKKREEAGLSTLGAPTPSLSTVRNYFGLAGFLEGRATVAAVDKTVARFVAERSYLAAVSMAMVASITSFIPTNGAGHESASIRLIQRANGGVSLKNASPFMITTTDETTLFATAGHAGGPPQTRLCAPGNM